MPLWNVHASLLQHTTKQQRCVRRVGDGELSAMQCRRTICDGAECGWRRISKQSEEHGAEKLLRMVTFDHITFELMNAACAALSPFILSPKSWPRGPAHVIRSTDLIRIQNLSPPSTARTEICDQRPCRAATPAGRPRPHRLTASPLASSRSCHRHLRASCRGEVAPAALSVVHAMHARDTACIDSSPLVLVTRTSGAA